MKTKSSFNLKLFKYFIIFLILFIFFNIFIQVNEGLTNSSTPMFDSLSAIFNNKLPGASLDISRNTIFDLSYTG